VLVKKNVGNFVAPEELFCVFLEKTIQAPRQNKLKTNRFIQFNSLAFFEIFFDVSYKFSKYGFISQNLGD
jgi:hypothetical protein